MTRPPHESGVREAICRVGRDLHHAGLIAGTAGNLSVRLDGPEVLVTPRGRRKDRLSSDDLVMLDLTALTDERLAAATTEWPVHRACYDADHSVRAVIHSHAPALTAVGIRRLDLTDELPEIGLAVGRILWVPFAPSGSEELGSAVGSAVADGGRLLLLARHGVVAVGDTLDDALDRTEMAELAARAVLLADSGA